MEDVNQSMISLTSRGKKECARKRGGYGSKRNITYTLKKEKRNGVHKSGGCDSKHDITYSLKKMEFVSMEDVIQNTTTYQLRKKEV